MAKLVVDYREHAFLSRLPAETKNLVLGDICIQKDDQDVVIIERKTVADLSASVCDGRYQEQSFRLLESNLPPHRIVYLIEGDIHSVQSISKKAMMSCMISLWFTKGFSVVQTKNLDETVEYVQLLLEKVDKESTPVDYVSTLKIKKKDKLTPDNIDILMLSQIPTISTITAKALIATYKNVFELTKSLKENRECLNEFTYGDKKRKLSKSSIKNLIDFLHV
jgi:ERCC4-type nuclease